MIAPGSVKVDMNRKTVQHQEGGIVGEILVRDGSRVKAGRDADRPEGRRVDAGIDWCRPSSTRDREGRAPAGRAGMGGQVDFPAGADASAPADPRIAELLRRESAVFRARREAYRTQIATDPHADRRDAQDEIRAREAQIKADEEAFSFQREELESNQRCSRRGSSARRAHPGAGARASPTSRRGSSEHEADLARARQKVSELELRAETLRSTMMQEAASEMRQTTAQILDLRERLRPVQDAEQRQRITAPIAARWWS